MVKISMMSKNWQPLSSPAGGSHANRGELLTRERWIEIARVILTGIMILLYWRGVLSVHFLWAAVAVGLYPLVKKGILDLIHERKFGTEIFVTIATLMAGHRPPGVSNDSGKPV